MRFALVLLLALPALARADAFDRYTNPILRQAVEAGTLTSVPEWTPELLAEHARVLPRQSATLVVVQTNEGRFAKLLVTAARQKVVAPDGVMPATGPVSALPLLLIERFVTYKEGTEQAVQATGQGVQVYAGFRFHLDLGQVVPEQLGGDVQVTATARGRSFAVKPVGKAKLFLVTKELPAAAPPPKPAKLVPGEKFEPRYFTGVYRLSEDGRRAGKLELTVTDVGEVTGAFTSDKDGEKYEVRGSVTSPKHKIEFTIKFPRIEQLYSGLLFTGDGRALCGTAKLLDRETGFYAVRAEE